jgi:hypothetical protein
MTLYDLKAKTESEKALTRLLNITVFLSSGLLNDQETEQFNKFYTEAKETVLNMMEGRQ